YTPQFRGATHHRELLPFFFEAPMYFGYAGWAMSAGVPDNLIWAARAMLRPIVRRLLAVGVPFGRLEASLRELFVEVAETALALPGRRQTDSRVSLLT